MIKLTFKKNSRGFYDFKVVQDEVLLYTKEYSVTKSYSDMGLTQAEGFLAFTKFLQDQADLELEHNPDFKWNSFTEFKRWAGAKMQHKFFEHLYDYIEAPKEKED